MIDYLKEYTEMNKGLKSSKKYYSLSNILKERGTYNVVVGERSNGKTYAVLSMFIWLYAKYKIQGAIIRRWDEDFKGKRGKTMFANHVANGLIDKYTNGEYNTIYSYSGQWFFAYQENGEIKRTNDEPFCFGFSLSAMEHDKSSSYPRVKTVVFDEFITRGYYLPDEFIVFQNVLSTIIRERDDVNIFMLGNTVNKYCPYFKEMGLINVSKMKQGVIDIYTYGDNTELRVVVEFSDSPLKKKKSDKYFAFNNPRLKMITSGTWEISIYPHLPIKYKDNDIYFIYFIIFEGSTLQCEIIFKDGNYFTYIHNKTTPIKNPNKDIVYQQEYDARPNYYRKITKPRSELEKKIAWFFINDKVFFQDNEVGEIVRNYLMWCNTDKGII